MTTSFKKGQPVRWNWGSGVGKGKIAEVHARPVSRTIKGKRIRRKGSPDKPAYLIVQDDGDHVLKLQSELDPLS